MDDTPIRDWLRETSPHRMTCLCERALKAASGIVWQQFGALASGGLSSIGQDYYDPARSIIAEYLRHTGRAEEAAEVQAVGCGDPPPRTGFAAATAADLAEMRRAMQGG